MKHAAPTAPLRKVAVVSGRMYGRNRRFYGAELSWAPIVRNQMLDYTQIAEPLTGLLVTRVRTERIVSVRHGISQFPTSPLLFITEPTTARVITGLAPRRPAVAR